MAWYGHDPTPAQLQAGARRKADAELNETNRHAKEEQATGYHVVTTWPRR